MTAPPQSEAKVNLSLKAPTSNEPWITFEGTQDEVLRALWRAAPSARPFVTEKNLFGAAYAADAEFKAKRELGDQGKAPAQSGAEPHRPPPPPSDFTETAVENLKDAGLISNAWSASPSGEGQVAQPGEGVRTCKHGTRTFRHRAATDVKKGLNMYFCALPMDAPDSEKCDPIFEDA